MHAGAALAPKMLAPEKSPGINFCRQFQKVWARKFRCHNLFVQNRSLSSMQIWSLMTPAGRFFYFGAIFMLKMKQKLRLRTTTGSLPTVCKQRMIPDICYGLWLIIMIDTKIFWFQMISTISWLI
jgi:hypothetical protein